MSGFYNEKIGYYEGDRQGSDPEVPTPPHLPFLGPWDGEKWVETVESVRLRRASEYHSIGDQLDAMLKYFDSLGTVPADCPLGLEISHWKQVKLNNPKPS